MSSPNRKRGRLSQSKTSTSCGRSISNRHLFGAAPLEIELGSGKGLFLTPGFSDMYTHYRDPSESPLYLAHGITTARTSGNPFQIGMERASALGAFPSPRMITVSHGIDGIGPNGRTDMPHGVPLLRPEDAAPLHQGDDHPDQPDAGE